MIICLHSVCLLVLNELEGVELNYFYYKIRVPKPQGIPCETTSRYAPPFEGHGKDKTHLPVRKQDIYLERIFHR